MNTGIGLLLFSPPISKGRQGGVAYIGRNGFIPPYIPPNLWGTCWFSPTLRKGRQGGVVLPFQRPGGLALKKEATA